MKRTRLATPTRDDFDADLELRMIYANEPTRRKLLEGCRARGISPIDWLTERGFMRDRHLVANGHDVWGYTPGKYIGKGDLLVRIRQAIDTDF